MCFEFVLLVVVFSVCLIQARSSGVFSTDITEQTEKQFFEFTPVRPQPELMQLLPLHVSCWIFGLDPLDWDRPFDFFV